MNDLESSKSSLDRKEKLLLLAGCLIVLLVFLKTLMNDLVWDDRMMIKNYAGLGDPGKLWEMLSSPFWFNSTYIAKQLTSFWRPLTTLLIWTGGAVFGKWAPGFHLISVLIATGAVVSFYVLIRNISWSKNSAKSAAWLALVFAIHPFSAEVISLVANASDHLVFIFVSMQVLSLHKANKENRKKWYWIAGGLALLSCFSKELGLISIGAPFAAFLLFKHVTGSDTENILKNKKSWLASVIPGIIYLALRFTVITSSGRPNTILSNPVVYLKSVFLGYGQLVYQAIVPVPRGTYIGVGSDYSSWAIAAVVWSAAILGTISLRRTKLFNLYLSGIAVSIAFLMPSFLAVDEVRGELTLHTRYFHLPFSGLLLMIFPVIAKRWREGIRAVIPVAVFLFSLLSWVRVSEWRDHVSLFTAEVAYNPRSQIGLFNQIEAFLEIGNFKKAEKAIENAENVMGPNARLYNARARLIAKRDKDWSKASDYLIEALKKDPANLASVIDLANVRIAAGKPRQAMIILKKARSAPWFQDNRKEIIEGHIKKTRRLIDKN